MRRDFLHYLFSNLLKRDTIHQLMQLFWDAIHPNREEFPRLAAYFRHDESARMEMWEKKMLEPSPRDF